MKKQINTEFLTVTIAILFIFSAFGSTFAQAKNSNLLTFNYLSSNAKQNLWLKSASDKFALTGFQANGLFAINNNLAVDDYPKPDFSEMEKWYEITKYEYADLAAYDDYLYFWVKPKTDTRPTFHVEYFDKEGVVSTPWATGCAIVADGRSHIGELAKCYASTPTEKDMDNMVRVKFVRNKQ